MASQFLDYAAYDIEVTCVVRASDLVAKTATISQSWPFPDPILLDISDLNEVTPPVTHLPLLPPTNIFQETRSIFVENRHVHLKGYILGNGIVNVTEASVLNGPFRRGSLTNPLTGAVQELEVRLARRTIWPPDTSTPEQSEDDVGSSDGEGTDEEHVVSDSLSDPDWEMEEGSDEEDEED
ncbi:uncharacterized protein BXZ73DRAFT_103831 [Epithele typhae]|uniref:uncharacterized protein n=1 Tax=Epithele typhae TaxID=378194 RepID=UPI0020076530|nr:uncharacterized protein BXZ73DRAFT_107495 [Epithele typhae]XP_047875442.1 uncharacterized protein BXZ73DRAFT_103831 [Epithele typhae]KAH9912291.1 hypothetical protein BXZ73DRAFT_107495 [Epithele typhae]KAH9923785.1 hypothetical protein BXZ73DRAFT_103831 [Epithele typhae]